MTIGYAADAFFPVTASVAFSCVSFPPPASPLRLLTRFAEPSRPIISDRRQLAWFSPQSRFIGASEVTSARSVDKGLGIAEPVAWEFFTPLHRVLLLALVAISSSESRRSQRILQLQRSVDIRDEILKNMQMKLDDLLNQMRFIEDHSQTSGCSFPSKNEQIIASEMVEKNESIFFSGDSQVSRFNTYNGIVPLCHSRSIKTKDVCVTKPNKERLIETNYEMVTEQEERRMSDLSDFCWSVASSVDSQPAQLRTLAEEQELYNLRKECEEKDATIKGLTTAAHASNVTFSKRITELEEVIRRKNMIITKLKKDMSALEQQIVKLTRLRRPSTSSSPSNSTTRSLPLMTENILYDMSCTSSSSDCDSPQKGGANPSNNSSNEIFLQSVKDRRLDVAKTMSTSVSTLQQARSAPLKENRVSGKVEPNVPERPRQLGSSIADQKARRRNLQKEKAMSAQKKWV